MITVKIERKRHTMIEECLYGVTVISKKHQDFQAMLEATKSEKDKPLAFILYDSPSCMKRERRMYAGEKVYIMNDIGKTIDTLYFNAPHNSEEKLNT